MNKRTIALHVVVGVDSSRNVPFLPRPAADITIRCEFYLVHGSPRTSTPTMYQFRIVCNPNQYNSLFKVFWSAEPFFQKRFCKNPIQR